jgi:UDP-2,3-diacylglucosamine pyrophosphatase LpxH
MKVIRCDLPYADVIELYPLSDLHLGDVHCDYRAIMERIEYIKNTENAYCVLDGDLMDAAIASSVGDTYSASLQPMEQLKQCVEIFKPLADKGKVLAVCGGNHEHRIWKTDGIDITALMCAQLGIADRYSSETAYLFIRYGDNRKKGIGRKFCTTLYMTHGSGGGKREGGKINRLADLANICDADIYVMGHTHMPAVIREGFYRAEKVQSSIAYVDRLFVNTAAWLRFGGYGEVQGFKPASLTTPVIYLSGKEKRMWAKL